MTYLQHPSLHKVNKISEKQLAFKGESGDSKKEVTVM